MFAGHETVSKTVGFSMQFDSGSILTSLTVVVRPLRTCQEASCPRKTSSRDHGNAGKN